MDLSIRLNNLTLSYINAHEKIELEHCRKYNKVHLTLYSRWSNVEEKEQFLELYEENIKHCFHKLSNIFPSDEETVLLLNSNYDNHDVLINTLRVIYWRTLSRSLYKSLILWLIEDEFYFIVISVGLLLCDNVDNEIILKYFCGVLYNIDLTKIYIKKKKR